MKIDQRAAGVAWVDGGIGLNEVLVVLDAETAASCGTHDSHRGRLADAERIADGENDVAHLHLGGIADRKRGQARGIDFDHRHIGLRIGADELCRELPIVAEENLDIGGAIDDVVVGEDRSIGGDNHAGTQAVLALRTRLPRLWAELVAEELPEERIIEELRIFRADSSQLSRC